MELRRQEEKLLFFGSHVSAQDSLEPAKDFFVSERFLGVNHTKLGAADVSICPYHGRGQSPGAQYPERKRPYATPGNSAVFKTLPAFRGQEPVLSLPKGARATLTPLERPAGGLSNEVLLPEAKH
jgi:hypothetical protein